MRVLQAAVLALSCLAIAACGGSSDEVAAPPTTAPEAQPPAADRQPAPPLEGVTLDGKPVSLEDFRGKPVLINVWSSW